jgi:hypothetical protein
MKGCFEFFPKGQDQKTRIIMENSLQRYSGKRTDDGNLRIKFFDLHINLRNVFSYDEILAEANRTINEMLKWEGEYLKELENTP